MSSSEFPYIVNAGADALMVTFDDSISLEANEKVIALQQRLLESELSIVDCVPAYSSLMVYYDVQKHSEPEVREQLRALLNQSLSAKQGQSQRHTIDVYYGEEVGPDLARVAEHHNQSIEAVIEAHTGQSFRVYAQGFAPGFSYMGILPDAIVVPRLERPREKILAGSVAVAEKQTAVYPIDSPGGWNIIGRTAQPLFQPEEGIISHLQVGDEVQFRAVSKQAFLDAGGQLESLDD